MSTKSTDGFVEIDLASLERSIWNRPGLIYAGLVALIVTVSLIARLTGILPLRDAPLPVGETQAETGLPLDHVRGWNPAATAIPKEQSHDQGGSLAYPWRRSRARYVTAPGRAPPQTRSLQV
jgi:hypothetical protein